MQNGPAEPPARVACILLAAGRSRRFGRANKLLAPLWGRPLVWHALDAAVRSGARPLIVVSGHQRHALRESLKAYQRAQRRPPRLQLRHNARYREGLSSSLQTGIAALPRDCDGALICLGDMPLVTAPLLRALRAAYRRGDDAVVPLVRGERGNPVLLGRPLFERVRSELGGDQGARRLLQASARLRMVQAPAAAADDVDTLRSLRRLRDGTAAAQWRRRYRRAQPGLPRLPVSTRAGWPAGSQSAGTVRCCAQARR